MNKQSMLVLGLVVASGAAHADTVNFALGATGTASGTGTIGSAPTITNVRWGVSENQTNPALFGPGGTFSVSGLSLTGIPVVLSSIIQMSYATTSGLVTFINGTSVVTAAFEDTVTLSFVPVGACNANSTCTGSFVGFGGSMDVNGISGPILTSLLLTSLPPAPNAPGTLSLNWKGTLTRGAGTTVTSWTSTANTSGLGPQFSGNLVANVQSSLVPEPSTYAMIGSSLFGLAVLRRRRKS